MRVQNAQAARGGIYPGAQNKVFVLLHGEGDAGVPPARLRRRQNPVGGKAQARRGALARNGVQHPRDVGRVVRDAPRQSEGPHPPWHRTRDAQRAARRPADIGRARRGLGADLQADRPGVVQPQKIVEGPVQAEIVPPGGLGSAIVETRAAAKPGSLLNFDREHGLAGLGAGAHLAGRAARRKPVDLRQPLLEPMQPERTADHARKGGRRPRGGRLAVLAQVDPRNGPFDDRDRQRAVGKILRREIPPRRHESRVRVGQRHDLEKLVQLGPVQASGAIGKLRFQSRGVQRYGALQNDAIHLDAFLGRGRSGREKRSETGQGAEQGAPPERVRDRFAHAPRPRRGNRTARRVCSERYAPSPRRRSESGQVSRARRTRERTHIRRIASEPIRPSVRARRQSLALACARFSAGIRCGECRCRRRSGHGESGRGDARRFGACRHPVASARNRVE